MLVRYLDDVHASRGAGKQMGAHSVFIIWQAARTQWDTWNAALCLKEYVPDCDWIFKGTAI